MQHLFQTRYALTALRRSIGVLLVIAAVAGALPSWAADGVVNINQASEAELALLPRIGPALAQRIAEFRVENGEFEQPADVMLVRGIGEKTFELLAPFIVISGETTLASKVSIAEAEDAVSKAAAGDDEDASDGRDERR